jgi:hypothetical protein
VICLLFASLCPVRAFEPDRDLVAVPEFEVTSVLRKTDADLDRSLAALVSALVSDRYAIADREKVEQFARAKGGSAFDNLEKARSVLRGVGAQRVFLGMATSFGRRKAIFLRYLDAGASEFSRTVTGTCMSVEEFPDLVPKLLRKLCEEPAREEGAAPEEERPEDAEPRTPADFLKDLDSPDAGVRFSAAVELGRKGNRSVAPALSRVLLEDKDVFVRRAAARSLGELEAWSAVPALIDALADKEYFVGVTAHQALVNITGQDFGLRQGASREEVEALVALARKWWEAHRHDRDE